MANRHSQGKNTIFFNCDKDLAAFLQLHIRKKLPFKINA